MRVDRAPERDQSESPAAEKTAGGVVLDEIHVAAPEATMGAEAAPEAAATPTGADE